MTLFSLLQQFLEVRLMDVSSTDHICLHGHVLNHLMQSALSSECSNLSAVLFQGSQYSSKAKGLYI